MDPFCECVNHIAEGGDGTERFIMLLKKSKQFNIYELHISGICYLIFSDYGCMQVTQAIGNKTLDKGEATMVYLKVFHCTIIFNITFFLPFIIFPSLN